MKKLLFTLIILVSALIGGAQVPCWDGTVAESYAGGDGTQENPYQIATPEQLALLAEQTNNGTGGDAHYLLTEDICLSGSQGFIWPSIGYILPASDYINPFTGVFDGANHTVSDLSSYQGLFGFSDGALIKNIRIEDAVIESGCYAGFIAGQASNSEFIHCIVSGIIQHGSDCGGIVGIGNQILVESCVNYGCFESIMGGSVGGIVGRGIFTIRDCDNYGTIHSEKSCAGGIAGSTTVPNQWSSLSPSVIEDCVNHESGEIIAQEAGGIMGFSSNAKILRCGNKANIKAQDTVRVKAGGITATDGRIINCYNTGQVSVECDIVNNIQMGGLSGAIGSSGYVRNCYVAGAVICPNQDAWCSIIAPVESTSLNNCYWQVDYNLLPSQYPSDVISASCPFEPGSSSSSWTLEEAQYGTTDLLEALNRGSIGECLWMEDVDGINGGLPIPTKGETIYPLYGNEWYYEIVNNDGSITYQHLEIAADTTIHHKDVVIIIKTNTLYDKGISYQEVTYDYIYQESNVVYWYNKSKDEFTVLYDFGAMTGDEWEIKVGDKTVLMHVDSVAFVDYEGEFYRKLMVVSDQDGVFSGEILCGVGHTTSFFPDNLMSKDYRMDGIRCFWNGKTLIQKWSDADCDEVYAQFHTGMVESDWAAGFQVYPNPTDGVIHIEMPNKDVSLSDYRITNVMGQILMTGCIEVENQNINISALPAGMYFITMGDSVQKLILIK